MLDPASVGTTLARLHRTPFAGSRGEDPWYRAAVGAPRWDELVSALTAAGATFSDDLAAMRDELVALEQLLVDPHDLRTCHRDLFPENLRGTASGSVCVIDWDEHGLAGASQELAFVVWGFTCGRPTAHGRSRQSYAASGGPGRVHSPGDFTMLIATLGHINERACARWLAPSPGRTRTRSDGGAVRRVGGGPDHPGRRSRSCSTRLDDRASASGARHCLVGGLSG